jgi:hypothetical protein
MAWSNVLPARMAAMTGAISKGKAAAAGSPRMLSRTKKLGDGIDSERDHHQRLRVGASDRNVKRTTMRSMSQGM